MKNKEIIIPILNDEYKVIICFGTPEDIAKVIRKWGHKEQNTIKEMENRRGVCFYSKGCHPVIAMPKKPRTPVEIGTLAHESVHAIQYIFESISEYSVGEVFAHSVGAVMRGVLKK